MSAGPDLPPIELIAIDGEDLGVEPEGRPKMGRPHSRRNALITLAVLVVGLLVVGFLTRDDPPPEPTLQEWAADQHTLADNDEIVLQSVPGAVIAVQLDVTCNIDPYDFAAVADCVRTAHERGLPASGHFMIDDDYPEATDVWLTFEEDGTATRVERMVSAEPHPDPGVGSISPNSLKRIDTQWKVRTCRSVDFPDDNVFPGFECEVAEDFRQPYVNAEMSEPLSFEERENLIRRFACTFPDIYTDEKC